MISIVPETFSQKADELVLQGNYEGALPLFLELSVYYKASEDYANYVAMKARIILCYFNLERIPFAADHVADIEPYESYLTDGDRHRYFMAQATLFHYWHDPEQCIAMYEKCFEASLKLSLDRILTTASNFASVLNYNKRFDEAIEMLQRVEPYLAQVDLSIPQQRYSYVDISLEFACYYAGRQQFDKVAHYLAPLIKHNYAYDGSTHEHSFERYYAELLFSQGKTDEAFVYVKRFMKRLKTQLDAYQFAGTFELWAKNAASLGRFEEAYEYTKMHNEMLKKQLVHTITENAGKHAAELKTKEFQHLAFEDPLTSLHNRRLLPKLEKDFVNQPQHITVAVLDIDRFKQINDTYGHAVGDELIIAVANRIKELMTHPLHTCIRFGGDEFIIVMRRPLDQAQSWIERLHSDLYHNVIDIEDITIAVQSSIGVASGTHTMLSDLTKQADAHLYAAKESGRNCIFGF